MLNLEGAKLRNRRQSARGRGQPPLASFGIFNPQQQQQQQYQQQQQQGQEQQQPRHPWHISYPIEQQQQQPQQYHGRAGAGGGTWRVAGSNKRRFRKSGAAAAAAAANSNNNSNNNITIHHNSLGQCIAAADIVKADSRGQWQATLVLDNRYLVSADAYAQKKLVYAFRFNESNVALVDRLLSLFGITQICTRGYTKSQLLQQHVGPRAPWIVWCKSGASLPSQPLHPDHLAWWVYSAFSGDEVSGAALPAGPFELSESMLDQLERGVAPSNPCDIFQYNVEVGHNATGGTTNGRRGIPRNRGRGGGTTTTTTSTVVTNTDAMPTCILMRNGGGGGGNGTSNIWGPSMASNIAWSGCGHDVKQQLLAAEQADTLGPQDGGGDGELNVGSFDDACADDAAAAATAVAVVEYVSECRPTAHPARLDWAAQMEQE